MSTGIMIFSAIKTNVVLPRNCVVPSQCPSLALVSKSPGLYLIVVELPLIVCNKNCYICRSHVNPFTVLVLSIFHSMC